MSSGMNSRFRCAPFKARLLYSVAHLFVALLHIFLCISHEYGPAFNSDSWWREKGVGGFMGCPTQPLLLCRSSPVAKGLRGSAYRVHASPAMRLLPVIAICDASSFCDAPPAMRPLRCAPLPAMRSLPAMRPLRCVLPAMRPLRCAPCDAPSLRCVPSLRCAPSLRCVSRPPGGGILLERSFDIDVCRRSKLRSSCRMFNK